MVYEVINQKCVCYMASATLILARRVGMSLQLR